MYVSINNYTDYGINFMGDLSYIKELRNSSSDFDIINILNWSKDNNFNYVYYIECTSLFTRETLDDLKSLCAARPNLKFCLSQLVPNDVDMEGIKYYYSPVYTAYNLEMLTTLCRSGVTDVFIGGELGFNMYEARNITKEKDIKIRVVPNRAQVSGLPLDFVFNNDNLTSFWIRPEDILMYNEYIDVIEFDCIDDKQAIFYDIYFQNKRWDGLLENIIAGVSDVDNRGLTYLFTEARLNCKKRCTIDKCHSCYRLNIAAKLIVENNLKTSS